MGLGVAGKGPTLSPPSRVTNATSSGSTRWRAESAGDAEARYGGAGVACMPWATIRGWCILDERHMTDWQCPSDSRCTLLFGMVDAANEARLV
jgi:hypothetical protein